MIKIKLSPRGGLPTALWASLIALVFGVVLAALVNPPAWAYPLYSCIYIGLFIYFPWCTRLRSITVSLTEIRVRQNGIFKTTHRLACRNITGTSILASPFQRALGVCCLVLHSAGTSVWLLGIRKEDAQIIVQALELESGV